MSEILKDESQIKEIHEKLLSILVYFKKFCEDNNLRFVLAGGTCLGAVRNSGFIPWDDDVDVFMPREDYEKLQELWNKNADTSRYTCERSNDKQNIHHTVTEIKDNNTTFINRHSVDLDIHQGIMIDVLPLDGLPSNKFSRLSQMINSMVFCGFNVQRLPIHKSKFTYLVTKVALSVIRSSKLRYKLWHNAERRMTKYPISQCRYIVSLCEGATIMMQRFPKEWFENIIYMDFEGYKMPVPSGYDGFLKISYGDYMKLPPVEERVFRHDIAFMDLNNCYLKYRGTKYFVNNGKESRNA